MTVEPQLITWALSLAALCATLVFSVRGSRRAEARHIEASAASTATLSARLDGIRDDVRDTKTSVEQLNRELRGVSSDMARLDASVRAAWKQLEETKNRISKLEEQR